MKHVEDALRQEVAKLLEEKKVDIFVGHEATGLPLKTSACFVRSSEEADRLVWNRSCASNLASYLPQLFKRPPGLKGEWTPPKVGVVVKGCDSRSVVGLIKEKQIPQDRLFVIGIGCEGMIDRHKVARTLGTAGLAEAKIDGSAMQAIGTDGTKKQVDIAEVLAASCQECQHREAVLADLTLNETSASPAEVSRYANVAEFEGKSPDERFEHLVAELSRCIRCYACREACPNCYCEECFAEETAPKWLGVTTDLPDVFVFHLGRAFHQAGRCVDCGACVAACPQGIDLRLLNQKINKDVEELFGAEASLSLEEAEALLSFQLEDDQSFMTEP
jgi:formate dehydrogenase subunit beta